MALLPVLRSLALPTRTARAAAVPWIHHCRGALRGAKVLRWECDTPLAREMAALQEASDFLSFCLERSGEFTRRDWLASLTLLTVRRRFSTAHPLFQRYSQRLLQEAEGMFEESVHLLLHRYGVLGYAPAVWKLLPLLSARAPLMTPKQLSLSAWAMGRTLVNDDAAWSCLGEAFCARAADFALPDLAMATWSLSAVDRAMPREVVTLKQAVRRKLADQAAADVSSHDLCMLFASTAKLTPHDRRFLDWLLLFMIEGMTTKAMPFTAQGLTGLWKTLADLRWHLNEDALSALCEESRLLRLDHTFNQDMAAGLARALLVLGVEDPRPTYQLVDFAARKGLSLRAEPLLALAEFFAARGVAHEVAWKRIGVRAQQRAVDLRLSEIDRLISAFRRSGKGNQRIYGMMQLFMRIREDQAKYGAA